MSSDAQITANRKNAQLSTGPTTETGKATSSHNAIKTGLTGRTVLLPTDDRAAFERHVARLFADFQPATDAEKSLVHSLAATDWRLLRIPTLESGIYAIGRRQLAEAFSDESDPDVRATMIEAQIFLTHGKDLSNLALQESRLRRRYQVDLAELKDLQRQRTANAAAQMPEAVQYAEWAERREVDFHPAPFGFEFSCEQVRAALDLSRARLFLRGKEQYAAEYHRVMANYLPKAA
jgi:hypothetical protein